MRQQQCDNMFTRVATMKAINEGKCNLASMIINSDIADSVACEVGLNFSHMPQGNTATTTPLKIYTHSCYRNARVASAKWPIICCLKDLQQTHALVARPFFKLTTLDMSSNAEK